MASSALENWVSTNIPAYNTASPELQNQFMDMARTNAQSLGTDALRAAQQDTSTLSALAATTGRNLLGYANLPFVATGTQAPDWIQQGLEYTKNPRFQAELPTGNTTLDKAGYLARSLGLELGGSIIDPANLIPVAGLSKVEKATSALAEAGKAIEAGVIPTAEVYQGAKTAEQLANTSALARAGEVFAKNAPIGGALSAIQSYGVNNGEVNPMEVLAGGAMYGGLGAVLGGLAQRSLSKIADEKLSSVFSPDLGTVAPEATTNLPSNMQTWGNALAPEKPVSLADFGETGGNIEIPQGRTFPSPDAESIAKYNAEAKGIDIPYAPEATMERPTYDMTGNDKAVSQFIKDEVASLPKEDRDTFFNVTKQSGLTPKEQVDFIEQLKTEKQTASKNMVDTEDTGNTPVENTSEVTPTNNSPEVNVAQTTTSILNNPEATQQFIKDEVATMPKADRDTFFNVSRESGLTPTEQVKLIDQLKGRESVVGASNNLVTPEPIKNVSNIGEPITANVPRETLTPNENPTITEATMAEKPQINTPIQGVTNGLQVEKTAKEIINPLDYKGEPTKFEEALQNLVDTKQMTDAEASKIYDNYTKAGLDSSLNASESKYYASEVNGKRLDSVTAGQRISPDKRLELYNNLKKPEYKTFDEYNKAIEKQNAIDSSKRVIEGTDVANSIKAESNNILDDAISMNDIDEMTKLCGE